jgi:hypothetical protein
MALISSPVLLYASLVKRAPPRSGGGRDAYPTNFELVIKLKAAKAAKLTILANIYLHHVYDQRVHYTKRHNENDPRRRPLDYAKRDRLRCGGDAG